MCASISSMSDTMRSLITFCKQAADLVIFCLVAGLANIGYSKKEACKLYARAPSLWCRKPESIVVKHTQLEELLQATPAEVRTFVPKKPTVLHQKVTSDAFVGLCLLVSSSLTLDNT